MKKRSDLYRELVNAEQALADVKAQLAHEQANRRRFEAEYRAEAEDAIDDAVKSMVSRIRSTIGSFNENAVDAFDSALSCIQKHDKRIEIP